MGMGRPSMSAYTKTATITASHLVARGPGAPERRRFPCVFRGRSRNSAVGAAAHPGLHGVAVMHAAIKRDDVGESNGRGWLGDDQALLRYVPTVKVPCGFPAVEPRLAGRRAVESAQRGTAMARSRKVLSVDAPTICLPGGAPNCESVVRAVLEALAEAEYRGRALGRSALDRRRDRPTRWAR